MVGQDKVEGSGTKSSGIAFESEENLPEGVPVGDQTPKTGTAENVTEKGGGLIGVKVPEEND